MPHYFNREEAEALLPQISIVLLKIQDVRKHIRAVEEELEEQSVKSIGNGHGLQKRISSLQTDMTIYIETLRSLIDEVQVFGCELKDLDAGLIDFLSLRNGKEIYLCWLLGEDRINYWHYLDTGFAG